MRTEKFKCKACNGSGEAYRRDRSNPKVRKLVECHQCDGEGQIYREVWETEDRMRYMSKLGSSGRERTVPFRLVARWAALALGVKVAALSAASQRQNEGGHNG